jgi:hypothetical protein
LQRFLCSESFARAVRCLRAAGVMIEAWCRRSSG